MNYTSVKQEINKLSQAISKQRREEGTCEQDLQTLYNEKKDSESNFFAAKAKREQQDRKKYTEELLRPLEEKRAALSAELGKLKDKYVEETESLTVDNAMQDSSSKQEILDTVRESADKLKELIISIVGERFYNELESQLSVPSIIEDTEKLEDVIDYFNICEKKTENISKYSGKITRVVNRVQSAIMSPKIGAGTSNTNADAVIAVLVVVLIFLAFKYAFPVYLCGLSVALVLNLMRHYSLFKILLIQKTVRDNVDGIEAVIRQQILENIEQRKQELKTEYDNCVARTNSQMEQVQNDIARVAGSAGDTFKFDDTEIRRQYETGIVQKEIRERNLVAKIARIEKDIAKNQDLLNKQRELLNSALVQMQAQYLDASKIGESYEFDPKFLQNVENDKLDFFTHPKTSCFFIYQEEEDVYDFIKLILLQLRTRLNPFAYVVDIYDPIAMGRDFLRFQPENPQKLVSIGKLFRIFTTEAEFTGVFPEYKEDVDNRRMEIFKEYDNIAEYNKYMLSIESLTETYSFVFALGMDTSFLQNRTFAQIAQNGGDLGVYLHCFVKEDDCIKMGARASQVLEPIPKIYTLDKRGAKPKAKTWLVDLIEEKTEEEKAVKQQKSFVRTPLKKIEPQAQTQPAPQAQLAGTRARTKVRPPVKKSS